MKRIVARTERRIKKFDSGKGGDQPHLDRLRSKVRKFNAEIARRRKAATQERHKELVDA